MTPDPWQEHEFDICGNRQARWRWRTWHLRRLVDRAVPHHALEAIPGIVERCEGRREPGGGWRLQFMLAVTRIHVHGHTARGAGWPGTGLGASTLPSCALVNVVAATAVDVAATGA